jgi:MFS family permease
MRRDWGKWTVAMASMVGQIVGNGPIAFFTFWILIGPVGEEFGWDRSMLSYLFTLNKFALTAGLILFGYLIDRYGIQKIMLPGIVLFGSTLVSVPLLPHSFAAFAAMFILMGFVGSAQTPTAYSKVISARFDRHRGLALGVALSGVGIGGMIVPQIAQYLDTNYGWQAGYAGIGLLLFIIAIPVVAIFMREPAGFKSSRAEQNPDAWNIGMSSSDAIRTWRLWCLAIIFFCVTLAVSGAIVHLVPFLHDQGVSPAKASLAVGAAAAASVAGRLLCGILIDRFHAPFVAAALFMIPFVGAIALLLGVTGDLAIVAAACFGVALGAEYDLMAFLTSRYFGIRNFGQIYGWIIAIFSIGNAMGPIVMAVGHAQTGNYHLSFSILAGALLASALLALQLGPYRYSEGGEDAVSIVASPCSA